ncbi:GTP cyclohydrolase I [Lichenibacterium ramalinae]|uniref:GTP cyclohydrolase I n=2 Tax=Lichenibacterium ramalinae TaxID=2316527 RepID=A0A4V1RJ77_9HYPH|nr:GTP cyclohydrolase I [Lichenibacterium ramalinae]
MEINMNKVVDPRIAPGFGNQTVPGLLGEAERAAMTEAAARKIEELFDVLRVDHRNDHNTRDTPARVARMMVEETLRGRYTAPPKITDFDNVERCDQLIVTGPIEVRSTCAHHLMPIYGHAVIGILPAPDGKIIGLSKYDRIVDYFSSRLQIQEELAKQIERFLVQNTAPRGLAVRISAVHMCKTHRGVRASHASRMVNTTYHGALGSDPQLKAEFLQECAMLERHAS